MGQEQPSADVSELSTLRQRVAELERTVQLYQAVFDSSEDGIVLSNDQGEYLWANPAAHEMLGYAREEFLQRLPIELIAEEDRQRLWDEFQAFKQQRGTVRTEYAVVRKDGGKLQVEATAVPNVVPGVHLAIRRDVSKRKEAERRLRQSEERFRALVENSHEAIALLDGEGRFLYVTPAVRRVLGYDPADLLGLNGAELIHPEDLAQVKDANAHVGTIPGGKATAVYRVRRADGTWAWVESVAQNLLSVPSVGAVVVNFRDVTEAKEKDALLSARVNQQTVLASLSKSGLGDVELQEFMGEVLSEVAEVLEVDFGAVMELQPGGLDLLLRAGIGWDASLVGAAKVDARLGSQAEYTMRSDRPVVMEDLRTETRFQGAPLLHEHGIVSGMSVVIPGRGKPYGVLGVHTRQRRNFGPHDINFLEAVAHILAATINRDHLDRLRNEFLGMVTHELRSPLAAIKAAVGMLTEEVGSNSETQELLQSVDDQTDRVLALVGNLLDMAQIEAGTFGVNPKPQDFVRLVEEVVRDFSRFNKVDVAIRQVEESVPVRVDPARVTQVINNLLSNAVRYAPEGTVVSVDVEHTEGNARVSISNRGPLIPVDKLPLLFRKFSQLDDGDKKSAARAGLGLAICKGIIEAHQGQIWVENDEDLQQVSFKFTVPMARMEAGTKPGAPRASIQLPMALDRVLVIDDEPLLLRLLERLLERSGYSPVTTTNPREGVFLAEREEPSLVLLDLMMPDMNGFEVLEEIRAFSEVPVIFVSASNGEQDKARGLSLGAADYITKPFSPDDLIARVAQVLGSRAVGS